MRPPIPNPGFNRSGTTDSRHQAAHSSFDQVLGRSSPIASRSGDVQYRWHRGRVPSTRSALDHRGRRRAVGPVVPARGPPADPAPVGRAGVPCRAGSGGVGTETSTTADAVPLRTPITRTEDGDRLVFSWATQDPPMGARYRLE